VFRTGTRLDGTCLQLVAAPAAQSPGRVGYVIGRRMLPRAVDRNRLRRLLRESVRAARPAIGRYDVILRLRRSLARADIATAAQEGRALIEQLGRSAP
jgi:ribonuclease P protein component